MTTDRARRPTVLSVLGRLLVAAALVIGLYGAWELFGTDFVAERERAEVAERWRGLHGTTAGPDGTDAAGTDAGVAGADTGPAGAEYREDFPVAEPDDEGILGLMHVPRWGGDFAVPIGTGSSDAVLDRGLLGHYDAQTQRIGEVGNAGLAGHRTGHGKPLREVHRLRQADPLVIETADAWLVYRVVARDIVEPHRSDVLDPVPPFDGAGPSRYLTLTTCDPIFGISERYIIWAEADYWTPKSEGLPPVLTAQHPTHL